MSKPELVAVFRPSIKSGATNTHCEQMLKNLKHKCSHDYVYKILIVFDY